MSSKVLSSAVIGLNAEIVEVEADTGGGDYGFFTVVGLPDAAVSESRERVRSAIKNSGLDFPKVKVTVNLAPADLKKHGPSYDLPIAISILLVCRKIIYRECIKKSIFVGELALSGDLRPITGLLSIAIKAKKMGVKTLYVPEQNAREAALVGGLRVIPIKRLSDLIKHLDGTLVINPIEEIKFSFENAKTDYDMSHIKGQQHVKRAMEIAAAGAHNMAMSGSPGSGKTLIAKTIPSILPDLTLDEALEVTKIYSVSGLLEGGSNLVKTRPYRSPHHSASSVALVGGGVWPRPGEISLAHRGVLFLDEFGEFPRQVLESLRQPLEDGVINISRASGNLSFPAKFILISAMNPCPCGYFKDKQRECRCSEMQVLNYKKKISGPILDRIDIHIDVPRVEFEKLSSNKPEESSVEIKKRIKKARDIQIKRFKDTKYITNSEMSSDAVKKFCFVCEDSKIILKNAVDKMFLSARAYFRVLKLARTIADLEGEIHILPTHIAEALQYRPKN